MIEGAHAILRQLAKPLAAIAALGWASGVIVSLIALTGVRVAPAIGTILFIGVFPLWLCAILMMNRLAENVVNSDLWKAAFRGCPQWLRRLIWASWGYSFFMFLFIPNRSGEEMGFAAGFIGVFYAAALGVFVTASTVGLEPNKCRNGHVVGPFVKYCGECGAPVNQTAAVQ